MSSESAMAPSDPETLFFLLACASAKRTASLTVDAVLNKGVLPTFVECKSALHSLT